MLRSLVFILLAVSGLCFAEGQNVLQKDFEDKFVGYKMDPFVMQESKECLLKPYIPVYSSFNIFDGPIYKKKSTSTTTQ